MIYYYYYYYIMSIGYVYPRISYHIPLEIISYYYYYYYYYYLIPSTKRSMKEYCVRIGGYFPPYVHAPHAEVHIFLQMVLMHPPPHLAGVNRVIMLELCCVKVQAFY